ncbi:MAG: NapC/NirT family cytochrome c [Ignavibacteria bacterium]
MSEEIQKEKKPVRFFKKIRGYKRFLLFTGIYIGLFLLLVAGSAEYTSRPAFCPTCHYMETFYQSWRTSAHNKVDCVECHFEPGLSGTVKGKLNGLVQIVSYVSQSYKKRKPWAEIPDNTCARSGCHEMQSMKDSTYNFKGVNFSHKNHLQEQRRGKTLKCTSCHSQVVQGSHIEVTETTCFTCHFKKSDDPEHKFDKLSDCKTCHSWENKTKEQMASYRYDHTGVVESKLACNDCHSNVVQGNGSVGKERCFQCHFETERLEKFSDTKLMHETHIQKHSMKCFNCHSQIEHKVQKMDPTAPPDCQSCHTNSHSSQVNLYTGENGFGVEKTPSAMFLNGINCRGCHVFHEMDKMDITTSKSGGKACEKCHGKGYDKLVDQWKAGTTKRLITINSIYKTVIPIISRSSNNQKPQAEELLKQAEHNIRVVEIGKSVHNIQFAEKLLIGAYTLMKQALTLVGSASNLPEFRSTEDFIPNECYSCHSGIQEISVKKFDMNFSHNKHIVEQKINCNKCHSNEQKHGALIVTKQSCNNCHHSENKSNDACANCHKFQETVYNGSYLGKNQPDYMKTGGAGCNDCHVAADKVIKPDKKICLKCHEAGYDDQMDEWKADVKKLSSELGELIQKTKGLDLSNEDKAEVDDARKVMNQINSYPSIYIHNYDLISTALNEKKKKIKNMIK